MKRHVWMVLAADLERDVAVDTRARLVDARRPGEHQARHDQTLRALA